jgi:hypothetical protein
MIGCYDFCGHYEWTFAWLEQQGGHTLVRAYWIEAISEDSQSHAAAEIIPHGFEGMKRYWGHTLAEEAAEHVTTSNERVYRIDMIRCPSKGFLLKNSLNQYRDYCDHCMGWIGPLMQKAGFVIDHEHNHQGQCWWEIRGRNDPAPPSALGALSGEKDVRLMPAWTSALVDRYERSNDADDKARGDQTRDA